MPRARRPSDRGILGRKGALNRWGGDEVAVTLPDFSTEEARATAERFRHAVAQAKPGYDIAVTRVLALARATGWFQRPLLAYWMLLIRQCMNQSANGKIG
jgi:GGDEF domain-containing protein